MKPSVIQNVHVKNMESYKGTGDEVANQFVITIDTDKGRVRVFQSYNSVIAMRDEDGKITLDKNKWDYSQTTSRYRNQFLRENTAEIRRKIQQGIYTLADLN